MNDHNNDPAAAFDIGRPLRTMFVITCMPVGGAETLLVEIVRRMDRRRVEPELCCLKYFGPLGEVLSREIPAFEGVLRHKYDFAVLPRLRRLMRERRIDAVITVGTGGDKMFWGRLAAWGAGATVVASALHSTGLPDHVEWLNRRLAPWTDAFIAVARSHGEYLARHEGCPAHKVRVIPNGVDTDRFRHTAEGASIRRSLGIADDAPIATIVAALRPEKNHELFLRVAKRVSAVLPNAKFLIVGDGDRRPMLESLSAELGVNDTVHFLGTRSDVPQILSASDVFLLTSHMEASPVSILEALACQTPVVAPRVGSIPETVEEGRTGYLADAGNEEQLASHVIRLMQDRAHAKELGQAGRAFVVENASIASMVRGYEDLICGIYARKIGIKKAQRSSREQSTEALEQERLLEPLAAANSH